MEEQTQEIKNKILDWDNYYEGNWSEWCCQKGRKEEQEGATLGKGLKEQKQENDRILKNELQEGSHLKKKQGTSNMGDTALESGDHVHITMLWFTFS